MMRHEDVELANNDGQRGLLKRLRNVNRHDEGHLRMSLHAYNAATSVST